MTDLCEACGREIEIAGGVANIWDATPRQTGGLTLELSDDSEFFLCYDCIEALPENPTRDDVDAIRTRGSDGTTSP